MPSTALAPTDFCGPLQKRAGRPAKHADAAAKMRAWRDANTVVTVRLTGKTGASVAKLAAQFEMSQTEVINQMLKFAAANRDWTKLGMTSFPHPDARFTKE